MGGQFDNGTWLCLFGAVAMAAAAGLGSGTGCGMMSAEDSEAPAGGMPTSSSSGAEVGGGGIGGEGGFAAGAGGPPDGNAEVVQPVYDQCPDTSVERPYRLYLGQTRLLGNTFGLADDYSSFCGGGASVERADAVYYIQAQSRGTLTVAPASADEQPVVYVESECGVRTTFGLPPDQLPCLDTQGEQVQLGVVADQELYIIVEGDGADGHYDVDVILSEAECGDGVINPAIPEAAGEQCDFGSAGAGGGPVAANGCDDQCRFEPAAAHDDGCPGMNLEAQLGQPISGYTVGFADDFQSSCSADGGPDRVYHLWLDADEQLQVVVEADFDVVLGLIPACSENQPTQPTHCIDSPGLSKLETLDFTAPTAAFYHIVVDGYDGASWGTYTLTATTP